MISTIKKYLNNTKGTEQHAIAWQPLPVPFKKVGGEDE